MAKHVNHKALTRTASLTSDIFSPLLMPTYALVTALWLTPMFMLPFGVRAWSVLGVFFLTGVVPAMALFILMRLGKVSDVSVSDRRQRPLPFGIAIVCYLLAAAFLASLKAPRWLLLFLLVAAVVALVELLVSYRWKISAHAGAAGGLLGFVAWLAAKNALIFDPFVLLSVAVLIVGTVGWARLLLRRHTPAQVGAGAVLGFAAEFGLLMI